jgi:hypothetical protein
MARARQPGAERTYSALVRLRTGPSGLCRGAEKSAAIEEGRTKERLLAVRAVANGSASCDTVGVGHSTDV